MKRVARFASVLRTIAPEAKRKLIRDGRVYHVVAPTLSGLGASRYQISWDAIQTVETEARRAAMFIGRGLAGPTSYNVKPRGLSPTRQYQLIASSGTAYGRRSGEDLMTNGIDVSLPERAHETIVLAQLTYAAFLPVVMNDK